MEEKPARTGLAVSKIELWTAGISLLAAIVELISKAVNYDRKIRELRV